MQISTRQPAPLAALPVETVHIQHHRLAEQARDPGHGAVAHIAHEHRVGVGEADVQRRHESIDGSIEMLGGDAGQDDAAHARIDELLVSRPRERTPAVDADIVAALGQPRRKLLGKRLKAAIAVGNAARAQDGDFHGEFVLTSAAKAFCF